MKISKKLAAAGAGLGVLSAVAITPSVGAISLTSVQPSLEQVSVKEKVVSLATKSSAMVEVDSELNCSDHMLMAKVTNTSKAKITPNVTFNNQKPTFPQESMPIEPGKTGTYFWSFSGNNLMAAIKVQVDTQEDVLLSPMINCSEPVSFAVTETSESMVSGRLTNNSSFVGQTVYTRVNGGDVRVETLKAGESRLIAMPFNSTIPNPQSAFVAIGTDDGFQGTYTVDLDQQIIRPLPVK